MRADKWKNDIAAARVLLTGYPGGGKTGSLASLANMGFKLRVLNYDGNPQSLVNYTKPEYLPNIDIQSFEDRIVTSGATLGVSGAPTAFINGFKALDVWRYEDPDGVLDEKTGKRWIDLGSSKDWGPDTIVVLDTTTGQGAAAMNRAMNVMNKTPLTKSQPMWGLAIDEQLRFIKRLISPANRHHVIVISHLKMVGPKDINRDDDDLTKEIKERAADLVPTRLYPRVLGWDLPQSFAGEFPINILAEQGRIEYERRKEMDLKLPLPNAKAVLGKLTVEDGMAKVFTALGYRP